MAAGEYVAMSSQRDAEQADKSAWTNANPPPTRREE
jgi:hypothetical protein